MNRKQRDIEHERISVLLRAEQAKMQVYADTQDNGSTSQLYYAMHRSLKKSASTPLCRQNAVMDERQMTAPKSDVMLIAETIATSVNAIKIPTEPRTSNSVPPTKAEYTHSLERQEVVSKLLKIGYDCPKELAPLDCVVGNVNDTDDDTIDFNGGDAATEEGPVESCSQLRDSRKEVQCIVPANESKISTKLYRQRNTNKWHSIISRNTSHIELYKESPFYNRRQKGEET